MRKIIDEIVHQTKLVLTEQLKRIYNRYLSGNQQIVSRQRLNDVFRLRDKIFFKKKKPESEAYPFSIVDPFELFGEDHPYGDFNLVGEDWREKDSTKPVAILWGFNNWKWGFVKAYLPEYRTAFAPRKILSLPSLLAIKRFPISPAAVIFWGYTEPWLVRWYAQKNKIKIFRMEDGFIRSSSLGAAHSTPYSLVLDDVGLHYNPNGPSTIENILNDHKFSQSELDAAEKCLKLMTDLRLSKYNPATLDRSYQGVIKIKKRVAVLGQVDNDMSIRLGNPDGWTMAELIRLAKIENPDADILYRPHPDIYKGYQKSRFRQRSVEKYCQITTPEIPLVDFLDTVDHVYTITSLSGLEALLKGKKVTVVGAAFYAGWGLTDDRVSFSRRTAKITLLELFAGVYLKYPRYLSNLENSEIGFNAACFRIVADQYILNFDLIRSDDVRIKKNEEDKNLARWPYCMFGPKSGIFDGFVDANVGKINFSSFLSGDVGSLFQLVFLWSICGRLKTNEARNIFIICVRDFADKDLLNNLLLTLDEYYPGEYIGMQFSWLLSESYDSFAATDLLSSYLGRMTRHRMALKDNAESEEQSVRTEGAFVSAKKPCDAKESQVLAMLFDQHFESKKYTEALKVAEVLLISGYSGPRIFNKLAVIAALLFDTASARSISKFSMNCDLYAENRKALGVYLGNVDDCFFVEKNFLKKYISIELVLNPERINNGYGLSKLLFPNDGFDIVLDSMLSLDNDLRVQKAAAYLEAGRADKSRSIIEALILGGDQSDKILVFYSRVLCALGLYTNAVDVMDVARAKGGGELSYRESLRVFNYLGRFKDALCIIEEANRKKIYLSEAVVIPTYLGLGRIEDGYRCYLNVPFRDVVLHYFPSKYASADFSDFNDILIMSVYGPGDEIRFASIYPDIYNAASSANYKVTCDYRFYELFSRSFKYINFIPVRRTRGFSEKYPREFFNRLPGADLCVLLDNDSMAAVDESKSIVMVSDLIWRFRKEYSSFPGDKILHANLDRVDEFKKALPADMPLVGLCWRSSLTNHARTEHYLTIEELAPLLSIKDVQFVNLQYDDCELELLWAESNFPGKLINISELDQYNDLDGVAALMTNLDLVIAPPTSVVELSGALGRPTWLFSNSSELNWRKIDDLGTDVWFHSIRIVEGKEVGDKKSLVEAIRDKLIAFAS